MSRITEVPESFNQAVYMIDRHLEEGRGENIAIYYEDKTITYAELAAMVNRTGNALKDLGVEMENRVMILLPDSPEFLYTYFGAMKIGAVPVPVNTLASSSDYLYFLNNSRAKVLLVSPDMIEKITPIKEELKFLRHIIVAGQESDGYLNYDELVSGASDVLEAAETSRDDVAYWMYTSGTTGFPKGVVHLHHDIIYYMYPVCEDVLGITEKDIIFSTSKIFFSFGRNNSVETPLLYGAAVVLYPEWPDPEKAMQVVKKYRPSLFFSVPTFYSALLREIDKSGTDFDLSSVRLCLSAGEALPKGIYEQWESLFGIQILDVIGSTDVGGEYLGNSPHAVKPGSTGKLLSGYEGELRDPEGNIVPQGEVGTLWIKNDGVAERYWNNHRRSKEVIVGPWFNTGDQFYQDPDGYYWYQGREDDMLKVSGQWVSYLEIERILQDHPAVSECAVIGAPDLAGLIRIKAFVIPREGYEPAPELEKELIDFVRDTTAHFKAPRWIEFAEEFPRTATGKLQRHKLR
ncbi:MAG: benzoate-CoA ligase family protein [Dehalococcoidales bacterium]|nr:benzoate-CoA ligase family protein [Dehalococcoidales bacterium]